MRSSAVFRVLFVSHAEKSWMKRRSANYGWGNHNAPRMGSMLSFAEEIYLLALDDVTGRMSPGMNGSNLSRVLVGAALCELSHLNKIDSDPKRLFLVDATPTGNLALDMILSRITARKGAEMNTAAWICDLQPESSAIEATVLESLVAKGIVKKVQERVLWIFSNRRYPLINNVEITDVERRLRQAVSDESSVPSPRDAVLISLVHACGLFREILSPREFTRCASRIETFSKLDLVGREVVRLIREAQIAAFSHL